LVFDNRCITDTLRNSLATGNWGRTMTGEVVKSGVSQVLKRDTSYFATLSHLRRVVAPIQTSSKSAKPRLLHNTHFGMICPSETPEGQKIGIVKNFSMMAKVSLGSNDRTFDQLMKALNEVNFETFDLTINPDSLQTTTKVMVNGNWIGYTDEPALMVDVLRNERRNGRLS